MMSLQGGRVLYSDGIVRDYRPPTAQTPSNPQMQVSQPGSDGSSGVVNFFETRPQGYRYNAGPNDLLGECAWYSQQITDLDGQAWRVGNTIQQKQQNFNKYRAQGLGFIPGEEQAQLGNSIIFNEGTQWGHVATISEIFQGEDGKTYYRLTESNYASPKTVTHDRVVSADDRKIVGILKTQPKQQYSTVDYTQAPQISGERELGVENNASATGEQERPEGQQTQEDVQESSLPPMSSNQQGGRYENMMSPATQRQGQVLGAQTTQAQSNNQSYSPLGNLVGNVAKQSKDLLPTNIEALGQGLRAGTSQLENLGTQLNAPGLGVGELGRGDLQGAFKEQTGTLENLGTRANAPEFKIGELGRGEATFGDVAKQTGQNIERANLTGQYGTGLSELLKGDVQGAKQEVGRTLGAAGNLLKQAPGALGQSISNRFTASADDGLKNTAPKETMGSLLGKATTAGNSYVQNKTEDIKNATSEMVDKAGQFANQVAGQGVQALKGAGGGIGELFKETLDKFTPERKIGNESAGVSQVVGENAQKTAFAPKNDTSDPFFKLGGAEAYKQFIDPQAKDKFGGALSLDMFNNDFFKDAGYIADVFGDTYMGKAATDKYRAYESSKYPKMGRMDYQEDYDRGEVDSYNKQVDEYNRGIDSYLNSIPSVLKGNSQFQSMPTMSKADGSYIGSVRYSADRNGSPIASDAAVLAQPLFSNPFKGITLFSASKPSAQVVSRGASVAPMMSSARPSSPQMSTVRPSAVSVNKPSASVSRPSSSPAPSMQKSTPSNANMSTNKGAVKAPAPASVSKAAPKPAISTPANANMSTNKGAVKAPAPASSKPAAKPQTVSQKVTNTVKNVVNSIVKLFSRR